MRKVKFDSSFTFKYSPRKGTKAIEYDDQLIEDEKQRRLTKVIELQKINTELRNQSYVNKVVDVLIEKKSKRNETKWAGRTDSNKWVIFDRLDFNMNDIVPVLITKSKGITLYGVITKKTKAVLIVHLYGLTADAIKISNYCSENNIFLVEDAAEAHGQVIENKKCGSFGQISTMSFYANKHVTTGEGGIILTDSDKFYQQEFAD